MLMAMSNRKTLIERIDSRAGQIALITMTNRKGASVTLSNVGAGVVSIIVPDREGWLADVVVGYDNAADYIADGPCSGKVPGRYANRIAKGHFNLDGVGYSLAVNNGPNALHGGPTGFQNRLWDVSLTGDDAVRFTRLSHDGEEGYPGNMAVVAMYRWTDDNRLELTLEAQTDEPTVVNLTNHTYFNLSGHDSGPVLDHELILYASNYLPTDETLIPSGELSPVEGTPMDFTKPHSIGRDIKNDFPALKYGKGYDNCWAVDRYEAGRIRPVAELFDPASGRQLVVETDQPGVQVYTGNWLAGSPKGKGGYEYKDYDAVAIECQDFPDAPNHPEFPSSRLNPSEIYRRHIIFSFKTRAKAK